MDEADLSLGEDRFSYGYGGTGKVATNKVFKEYGESYGPGDFIGCFVVNELVVQFLRNFKAKLFLGSRELAQDRVFF